MQRAYKSDTKVVPEKAKVSAKGIAKKRQSKVISEKHLHRFSKHCLLAPHRENPYNPHLIDIQAFA